MQHPEIARLARERSRSMLGRLLDAAPMGASMGVDGRIVYANPECARMFGFADAADMLDRSFFDLIDPEFHPFVIGLWHARSGEGDAWTYELYGLRQDGTSLPYSCTSVPVAIEGGRATFAYFEDLSQTADGAHRQRLHEEHAVLLQKLAGGPSAE